MKDRFSIEALASLAHLSFDGQEKEQMRADMESIIRLMDTVAKAPLSKEAQLFAAKGGAELLREDEPKASMAPSALLSNAQEKSHPFFAVQKLMD